MGRASERKHIYGGPKPVDYVRAHNHVAHVPHFGHGANGFRRFWISPEWIGKGWSKCPCGWGGPKWETHYAITPHVQGWKKQIKKYGGLEGAYRDVIRRLKKAGVSTWTVEEVGE
jgi:hypothetical protein